MVILVAAKVFNGPLGPEGMVATISGLSKVFEPVAGPVGNWIFALGYFAAAFSAMTANATAGGIMLSDALGKGASAKSRTARIFSPLRWPPTRRRWRGCRWWRTRRSADSAG
ncbi:MAG: divalent metal cation transporter [Propionibacteriaceae bacterium]|nr:divalent metal cation transporter [Propionibacteriaceae bacterium]